MMIASPAKKNLFSKPKSVEAFVAPKAGKAGKPQVTILGLMNYTSVDVAVKALGALGKTMAADIKEFAKTEFMAMTKIVGHRPDNFKGVEIVDGVTATASMELRKRSSASSLTEEEAELLKGYGLKVETKIAVNKLFGINPKYAENEELLAKVSAAIEAFVPEDFIVEQAEVSSHIVSDETIEAAFKVRDPAGEMPNALFDVVTTLAIKPKMDKVDLPKILDSLKEMVKEEA